MRLIRFLARSVTDEFTYHFQRPQMLRTLSTFSPGNSTISNQPTSSSESVEDIELRIFGDNSGKSSSSDAFFQKLDRIEKARERSGSFGTSLGGGNSSDFLSGLYGNFNTLSDGMDGKLKKAATYFEFNPDEIAQEDYSYRPDMTFLPKSTYDTKDLDLTKPGVRKPFKRQEFEVTTEEVLRKADFRNVRFLAKFITEAGIIIKRSKTGISAKAQRKIAREIKTARAFGLMPFTTMGTKHFVFGETMENLEEDYEYDSYDSHPGAADVE